MCVRVAYGITNKVSMINPYVAMLSLWTIHLQFQLNVLVHIHLYRYIHAEQVERRSIASCGVLTVCAIDFRRTSNPSFRLTNYKRINRKDTKILFTSRNKKTEF